jgi:hypothetical protein
MGKQEICTLFTGNLEANLNTDGLNFIGEG